MPVISAALTVQILASVFWFISAAIVVNRPESAAMWCVLGAGPGAIVALTKARTKGASANDQIRIFLGSSAMGVFVPGLLCRVAVWRGWLPPDSELFHAWDFWAFVGFVLAVVGWKVFERVNLMAEAYTVEKLRKWERYFHTGDEADKPSGKPPGPPTPPKVP